jgi:outer membrane protein assembly factor BamB
MAQQSDEETTLCLDADTGRTVWRSGVKAKFDQASAGPGPHATPTVSGDRVYVVGATGLFRCLHAATGAEIWQVDLIRELGVMAPTYGVSTSPLVDGDRVIIVQGPVAAFDRRTGKLAWKSGGDRPAHSSAVLATLAGRRQIVAVTGQSVVGLNSDGGGALWTFPWETRGDYNIATPLVAGSYVFVSSGYGKGCALIEVGRSEARAVYEHNRMRNVFSSCVLHRDQVYGFDENLLVCMDLRTGAIRWKQRGFEKGAVVRVGDRLIVLGEAGRLALVDPSPDAYRELATADVSKTRCWAGPSPARGRLYFRDQETVRCFDLAVPR